MTKSIEERRQSANEASKRWQARNPGYAAFKAKKWAAHNPIRHLLNQAKRRDKDAGREFGLTREWLETKLEPMRCETSGITLIWDGPDRDNPWAPSLDRLDHTLGYIVGNVRIVCWIYNRARNCNTDVDVMKLARALAEKEKQKWDES